MENQIGVVNRFEGYFAVCSTGLDHVSGHTHTSECQTIISELVKRTDVPVEHFYALLHQFACVGSEEIWRMDKIRSFRILLQSKQNRDEAQHQLVIEETVIVKIRLPPRLN